MLKLLYTVGKNKSYESLEEQFEKAALAKHDQDKINDWDLIAFATSENVQGLKDIIKTV